MSGLTLVVWKSTSLLWVSKHMELFCVFFDLNESLYFWCQGSLLITVVGGKQVVQGVPHICFLSGLTGEEILMFVRAFPQSGNFFSMLPFLHQPWKHWKLHTDHQSCSIIFDSSNFFLLLQELKTLYLHHMSQITAISSLKN
jgi:hypothetical protein